MKKLFAIIFSLSLILSPVQEARAAAGGGGGMFKQILTIATGIVGTTILTKCKLGSMQPSLYAFMGGSLVQIIGEVAAGKEKNAAIMSQASDVDAMAGSNNGEFQRQTIQSQIDSEESNLKVIQKRRKFITAVTIIYGVATILAVLELLKVWYAGDIGACTPNPGLNFMWTLAISTAYNSALDGFSVGGAVKGATGPLAMKAFTMVKAKLAKDTATKVATETAATTQEVGAVPMLNSAGMRIGVFGAFTVLAGLAMGELKKAENEKKKNIETLKKALASMPQDPTGVDPGKAGINGDPIKNNEQNSKLATNKLKGLANPSALRTCLSGSLENPNLTSDACKNPIRIPRTTISGLTPNLSIVGDASNAGADMAQALADGDIDRADVAASKLGSMAGRLNKIRADLLKKVNDKLVAEGKKPIDINAEADRQVRAVSDALKKNDPSMGGMNLANLSSGEANVSETINPEDLAPAQAISAAPVVATPTATEEINLSDIGTGEDVTANDLASAANAPSLSDSLDQYESNESDISKDSSVSIFKQLSNRYILNYTKIFNRKETPEPVAEPVKE